MNTKNKIEFNKFKVAFNGLKIVFAQESSFRYQLFILIAIIILGIFLNLSIVEWAIIAAISATVLTFEIINTAIENIVDVIYPGYHENAKRIKDISAGAVLIAAIGAFIVGLLIFVPKIMELL